jgi:hypothetical protein
MFAYKVRGGGIEAPVFGDATAFQKYHFFNIKTLSVAKIRGKISLIRLCAVLAPHEQQIRHSHQKGRSACAGPPHDVRLASRNHVSL